MKASCKNGRKLCNRSGIQLMNQIKLVAVRKDSPLIVGLGKDEYFIASDIPAILNHTRDIYLLEDKEFVVIN